MRDRLNLSFDSVSLDSGRRETTDDDIDFYGGGSSAVAGQQKPPPPQLLNGGEPTVRVSSAVSSSAYSEALTPVTNKVSIGRDGTGTGTVHIRVANPVDFLCGSDFDLACEKFQSGGGGGYPRYFDKIPSFSWFHKMSFSDK
jgi:hypothetical protein